jgi:hypothetical protein
MAGALDYQLNHILIAAFSLVQSTLLEPVVVSLDSSRKIEMLKNYAAHIRAKGWREALKGHLLLVEKINSARDKAAHC